MSRFRLVETGQTEVKRGQRRSDEYPGKSLVTRMSEVVQLRSWEVEDDREINKCPLNGTIFELKLKG